MLVCWSSSVKNLSFLLNLGLEVLFSILALELVCVATFFSVLALNEEFRELSSEFSARDDTFFGSCLSNTDINSSFECRFFVVTG